MNKVSEFRFSAAERQRERELGYVVREGVFSSQETAQLAQCCEDIVTHQDHPYWAGIAEDVEKIVAAQSNSPGPASDFVQLSTGRVQTFTGND